MKPSSSVASRITWSTWLSTARRISSLVKWCRSFNRLACNLAAIKMRSPIWSKPRINFHCQIPSQRRWPRACCFSQMSCINFCLRQKKLKPSAKLFKRNAAAVYPRVNAPAITSWSASRQVRCTASATQSEPSLPLTA